MSATTEERSSLSCSPSAAAAMPPIRFEWRPAGKARFPFRIGLVLSPSEGQRPWEGYGRAHLSSCTAPGPLARPSRGSVVFPRNPVPMTAEILSGSQVITYIKAVHGEVTSTLNSPCRVSKPIPVSHASVVRTLQQLNGQNVHWIGSRTTLPQKRTPPHNNNQML